MTIILGADHRGFALKETLKKWLEESGYPVIDKGAMQYENGDDYVLFAKSVATAVLENPENYGIVLCGSGVGVLMVANKTKGIRCGLGITKEQVIAARRDDDIAILALASDFTSEESAKEMIEVFLKTPFSQEERHKKRLSEIAALENNR